MTHFHAARWMTRAVHDRFGRWMPGMVLLAFVLPVTAIADTDLHERDVFRVLNAMVSFHYQKTKKRRTIESACYFDPQVEKSMSCPWQSGGGGADPHRLRQKVQRNGAKYCKQRGGENCILLWRNGKLKFDSLSPEDTAKLESVMTNLPAYNSEANPLPDGVEVGSSLRERFEEVRDWFEDRRKKRRGHKPHYAVCASDRGPWASAYQEGGSTHREALAAVREMCILKCKAAEEWFSKQGTCYLVYEDGKFASTAAQQAVAQ